MSDKVRTAIDDRCCAEVDEALAQSTDGEVAALSIIDMVHFWNACDIADAAIEAEARIGGDFE